MLVIFQLAAAGSSGAAGGRSPRTTTIASVTPAGHTNSSAPQAETVRLRTAGIPTGSSDPGPAAGVDGAAERSGAEVLDPSRATTPYTGIAASGATAPSTMDVDRVRPTTCHRPSGASRVI